MVVPHLLVCVPSGWLFGEQAVTPHWGVGGGRPDGVPHHEGGGGRRVGSLEHQRLHLRLHPHQRHGGTHPHSGECHHRPPVHYRHAVGRPLGPRHLRPPQEALRVGGRFGLGDSRGPICVEACLRYGKRPF